VPIVITEQYPHGLGNTIDSVHQAIQEVDPPPVSIEKVEFDACQESHFTGAIETAAGNRAANDDGGPSMILCGLETHVCVYQTARSLISRGFDVHVAVDATCCRSAHNHAVAQGLLRDLGASCTSTETVLFDLLGRAGDDDFKAISALVR
jgi:nicotinamidase-related amidase